MKAVGNHLIIERLAGGGVTTHARGRVLSVGEKAGDWKPGDVILYFAGLSENLDGTLVLMNPKASVVAIDKRENVQEEFHGCFGGLKNPGKKEDCDVCEAVKKEWWYGQPLKNTPALSSKLGHGKRDLPPNLLEDLATRKITPQQAKEIYGIEMNEDDIIPG